MFVIAAMLAVAAPQAEAVTVPGPQGPLAGTLERGAGKGPVVVIIPGSGPTDRDGNSPLGITAAPYRLLAEALAKRGVTSVRIDKRGMFGSRAAIADPNAAAVEDYAADARAWAALAAKRSGADCAWLVGHSEDGLVALQAAQDAKGLCGVILVAAPGRRLSAVMREQLRANPANAPILPAALEMLDAIDAGRTVDPATLPAPLPTMFPVAVQRYLGAISRFDPVALAASAKVPAVIVQGESDLQVGVADARRLAAARPKTRLVLLPGVNHVLKQVGDDRAGTSGAIRTRHCRSRRLWWMRWRGRSSPPPFVPSSCAAAYRRGYSVATRHERVVIYFGGVATTGPNASSSIRASRNPPFMT